jgi:hypothetical protein
MRILMTAAAAAFLLLPLSQQAGACGASHAAESEALIVAQAVDQAVDQATVADLSAKKKEKVEYMKSAAGPEPKAKKKHKKKKKAAKAK